LYDVKRASIKDVIRKEEMMIHPLVAQLYFTRDEWQRGIEGVSPVDAIKHIGAMNSISWLVGHMAWQEQKYWLELAQGKKPFPDLAARFAAGAPKNSPPLNEVVKIWFEVTRLTRPYLDKLTTADLEAELLRHGKPVGQSLGSAMLRLIYHYWHHNGEVMAIRQLIGHHNLPEFVGDLEKAAPFRSVYSS
jgi:uncharacterized damage-inducible protein DinB